MSEKQIDWQAKREVYYSDNYSTAFVKVQRGGYMELDDYREHGGRAEDTLPPDATFVGYFTNAEIQAMDYPS